MMDNKDGEISMYIYGEVIKNGTDQMTGNSLVSFSNIQREKRNAKDSITIV